MKHYILSIIALLSVAFPGISQNRAAAAAAAYENKNYPEAIEIYSQILEKDGTSGRLYYNLGNAYFRNGEKGKAVLFFERALKADPRNKEAAANLDFVKTKLTDKIDGEENILQVFLRDMRAMLPSNGWAILGIVSFLLFIAGIALYSFGSAMSVRKIGFFGGLAMLAVSILSNIFSYQAYRTANDDSFAIVTCDSTLLSTVPREPAGGGERAFVLHEGAKVEKLDSMTLDEADVSTMWYKIRTADRQEAWISGPAVEGI